MKAISGHTTPFAVLGHPIGHSLSPVMHNASIEKLGLDAIYLAFDAPPDLLMEILPAMQKLGFQGVNLTVPLKEVAFKGLSQLDESARLLGAVNTVEFTDSGEMKGHNTDGAGFIAALKESFDISPEGMDVFVLGTGGAGRAVAITAAQAGCASVSLSDLDSERTRNVAREIEAAAPHCKVEIVENAPSESARNSDLIIQATPVGMKPEDEPILKADAFRTSQFVYDLIYMYPETGLMKEASSAGAKCANGLSMLLHQGAVAFKIWTSIDPDIEAMRSALESSVYGSKV